MIDPFEEHHRRPLAEHLADYRRELEARDNAPRYVALVVSRLAALLDGCGFRLHRRPVRLPRSGLAGRPAPQGPAPRRTAGRPGVVHRREAAAHPRHQAGVRRHGGQPATGSAAEGNGKARRFPRATVEALQDALPAARACRPPTTTCPL